ELYWDDAESLSKKYDLVNASGLRGVGIWNLNYGGGAPELWSALASHFGGCTDITMSFSPSPPSNAGTAVTVTAAASGCTNPQYEFWLRPATSSTWQLVQGYSASPAYQWNTTGAPSGTVYFGVWARDAGSTASADASSSTPFGLFSPSSGVTTSFTPGASAAAGTAVTVTAAASGCASPLYEFWMRPASSSTWQLLQAY